MSVTSSYSCTSHTINIFQPKVVVISSTDSNTEYIEDRNWVKKVQMKITSGPLFINQFGFTWMKNLQLGEL